MKYCLIIFLLAVQSLVFASDVEILNNPQLLEYARTKIPNEGFLRKERNGFVYLQVSNAFIKELNRMINVPEAREPPYFKENGVGAHISIIRTFELNGRDLRINGLGTKIPFEITNLCQATPTGWPGCKKIWMLQVKCPQLEALRRQLGFPPKINGHEFHITIGLDMQPEASLALAG